MPSPHDLYPSLQQLAKTPHPRLGATADLFTHPLESVPTDLLAPERLTQLLLGEAVEVLEERLGWMRVRALHQPHWSALEKRFIGYEGWISLQAFQKNVQGSFYLVTSHQAVVRSEPSFASAVIAEPEMGSFMTVLEERQGWHRVALLSSEGWIYDKDVAPFDWMEDQSESSWRWQWCESALRFRSSYYLLGGMGVSRNARGNRGIDCSGLLHLVARRLGMMLPRDSTDQYRWFKALGYAGVSIDSLRGGDFLFLSESSEEAIDHVMIYQGEGEWLESTRTRGGFWESTTESRLGEIKRNPFDQKALFEGKDVFHSSLQKKNVYPVRNDGSLQMGA